MKDSDYEELKIKEIDNLFNQRFKSSNKNAPNLQLISSSVVTKKLSLDDFILIKFIGK